MRDFKVFKKQEIKETAAEPEKFQVQEQTYDINDGWEEVDKITFRLSKVKEWIGINLGKDSYSKIEILVKMYANYGKQISKEELNKKSEENFKNMVIYGLLKHNKEGLWMRN